MTELCLLAEKHRSDKCPKILHSYTPEYHRLLNHLRDSAKMVLEVGIGFNDLMRPIAGSLYRPGASLRMWRDYFYNAQVIGCDIRKESFCDEHRVRCLLVDQSDYTSLASMRSYLQLEFKYADVIIDDGSHVPEHMVLTFKTLWPLVRDDGFYIIEDIRASDLRYFERLPILIGIPDCQLVYSHKGNNTWDSFVAFKKVNKQMALLEKDLGKLFIGS